MAYNLQAGTAVDVTLSFDAALRPYFEVLYADKAEDGENRKDFLERLIKQQIMGYYVSKVHKDERAKIITDLVDVV
jgi:hypothetical protein